MKKNVLLTLCIVICCTLQLLAQKPLSYKHDAANRTGTPTNGPVVLSSGQSGTGANYDVKYHKMFWRINPDSTVKYIRGYVQTNFLTITGGITSITMDINSVLTIDSVRFHNAKLATGNITRSGNIATIALGTTLANNVMDSIWIYYQGTPPAVVGAAEGYQVATDATTSQKFIYTLAESYEDRDWWPCKADMKDKIDSMDIIVNVPWSGPDTFWVATNGKLIDSTIAGGSRTFWYKNRAPMASYLVCVGVGRYSRYYRSVNISGVNVPIVYHILRGKPAATITTILAAMDTVTSVLKAFSNKFGDYPYKYDKHGFYEGLNGAGGMEHQSFSAIAASELADIGTLSHELMHQWFGDKATFATWADLWLAEGFARYAEALAGELVPGTGLDPVARRTSVKTSARAITTTSTRITSFANSAQVWSANNTKAVYDRGCMVVSMLRALSGDTKFFQACKNYLDSTNGSGYKAATTDSLKANFNAVLGYDLTPFFNDFVIGVGHPTTVVNWNSPSANKLTLSVASQTRSASSTSSYFHNVIVVRVQGASAGQDTTIVFYDINGSSYAKAGNGLSGFSGGYLAYTLSFTPTTVTFDPFAQTMSAGSTAKVTTLDLKLIDFTAKNSGSYNEAFVTLDDNSSNTPVIIEKSPNGINFSEAGNMSLVQSPSAVKNYYFKDNSPFQGATYYRVKYKGDNGEFVYSKIIKITIGNKGSFSVINNPAKGSVRIKTPANINYQVNIYDANGKLLISDNRTAQNNMTSVKIDELITGTYLIKISGDGQTASLKFIVE